jgi:hypothetical protein
VALPAGTRVTCFPCAKVQPLTQLGRIAAAPPALEEETVFFFLPTHKKKNTLTQLGRIAAAPPALEEETMLRTCSTDASTRSPAWAGSEATCICRPSYFGQVARTSDVCRRMPTYADVC